ncbi:MAG: hypothetical protein GWN94_11315, partial [Phycisphaerae bacterium]|nr:hypothetical protein [Phycisphaerae bacterium]
VLEHDRVEGDSTYSLNGETVTIPSNVTLKVEPGAIIDNGALTINGLLEAGICQIFGSSLTVTLGTMVPIA